MATKRKVDTAGFLAARPVFSLDDAAKALAAPGGRQAVADRLKYYRSVGRIKLVTREVYAVVPPGIDPDRFQPDPFLVASTVRPEGVFSYHSALELLGAAHSVWNVCTLFVDRRRGDLDVGGTKVRFLESPKAVRADEHRHLGTRRIEHRGRLLRVTGAERTLVEGFRRPSLVGGAEELVQSAAGFATLDLQLLEEVLKHYDARNLWAAAGWFLEHYGQTFHASNAMLNRLWHQRPQSPQYLERGSRQGTLAARWNLILPADLAKMSEPDDRQP